MPASRRNASRSKAAETTDNALQDTGANVPEKTSSGQKRTRELEDAMVESDPSPKKKKGPTKDPEPILNVRRSARSPKPKGQALPRRRKYRTKAEIEAAKAAVEDAKRQKEEVEKEAQRQLAMLDVEDGIAKARAAERVVMTFSDVHLDSSGEEFVGYNDVASSTSSDEEEVEDYKSAYNALQQQLKALEQRMASGSRSKRVEGGKKRVTKKTADASGLLPDSRLNAPLKAATSRTRPLIVSAAAAGGLKDDDADATKPGPNHQVIRSNSTANAAESGPLKRDLSRQNTLVSIVGSYEESQPVKKDLRRVPGKAKSKAAIEITTEVKENYQAPTKKRCVITTNNVRVSDLPDFAKDQTWKKVFLPTLYDRFFSSEEPFAHFAKGSTAFIAILQEIVNAVYPTVSYRVSASEAIHALAYNRINEKRSLIGSHALDIIKEHILTLRDEKAARSWLLWASRPDGPIYWKVPVAPNAPLNPKDTEYIRPEGPLMTAPIINLVTSNLRAKSGSVMSCGHPRGLVALVIAAFERAVRILLHPPPSEESAPEFSSSTCGSKVEQCISSLNSFSESKWKELLGAFTTDSTNPAADPDEEEEYKANLSFMDHRRANLFNFSSPIKA